MGNLLSEFGHLFTRKSVLVSTPTEENPADADARRRAEVADARIALGTQFIKEYRELLDYEIGQLSPDPLLGSDVGACVTFKREGLMRARQILDEMKRLAEEKNVDA